MISSSKSGLNKLLITGGSGFIGANFVHHWRSRQPQGDMLVLEALTYAGNRANLALLQGKPGFRFVQGDICDTSLLAQLFATEQIDTVVHFAAESHVDCSILGPSAFVQTNVVGTFTLLEALRDHWEKQGKPEAFRFLHVSTDEVFGSLGPNDPAFSETSLRPQ